MTALVHRLPLNELGRDFVAGDVHGSYQLLCQALRAAHFDVERDRLLLTGDLVDRGPDSAACLALTREPWVHSARGNHEQMALDAFDDNGALQVPAHQVFAMHRNGMSWWLELTSAERVPLLALARQLPLALEVPTHRGTVGLVHADVPQGMSWPEFLEALEQADERTCQIALWGRQRIEAQRHEGVPGVGRVFVGHTPQWGGLKRYGNVYAVDTGAVYGQAGAHDKGALSLTNVVTATAATLRPTTRGLIQLLDDPTHATNPFGSGAQYLKSEQPWRWPWVRR